MTGVVTQPSGKFRGGRPVVRPFTCDVCRLPIPDHAAVLYALQEPGEGPYPGMSGRYTAVAHADPCGASFLRASAEDYRERPCRGCHRPMWTRARSQRTHCSSPCRQADYRRRRDLAARALADGRVLYRDELYWLTRPGAGGSA